MATCAVLSIWRELALLREDGQSDMSRSISLEDVHRTARARCQMFDCNPMRHRIDPSHIGVAKNRSISVSRSSSKLNWEGLRLTPISAFINLYRAPFKHRTGGGDVYWALEFIERGR
ncbi:hypothetical protein PM082_006464 [Marasmius tenuissimus]|nr:hypothetical protein PM082_006464 [Marasmius tenuissimus]